MSNPSASHFPLQPASWSEIARLCRRICLLRELGQPEEAEQVRQGALANAVGAIRAAGALETTISQQLEATFAAEAERVANAAALAELLRPMLAGAAGGTAAAITPATAAQVALVAPFTSPTPLAAVPAPPPAETPRAAPGDIASFIDDMLAQDRGAARPAPMRRVS